MPPSSLIPRSIGRDHEAGIGRTPHAPEPHFLLDLDLRHHGGERGDVLVAREAEAACHAVAEFRLFEPAAHLGRHLDHTPRTRIGQQREPVAHRVLARDLRQFVDERLDREHVGPGAETAQRRRS